MRYAIFIIILMFVVGCSDSSASFRNSNTDVLEGFVYVCNGKSAKRYHMDRYCKGLRNCRSGISEISLEEAMEYRTPCKICCE